MEAVVIVLIILLGLVLILLEFFVIPGVSIAGIGGFIFSSGGVYLAYQSFGAVGGHLTLFVTVLLSAIALIVSLKSGSWQRLSLNTVIDARVETVPTALIHEGDEGVAITRLNPIGNVRVNNELIEGRCPGQFLDENTLVVVQKVFKTYIIVKPKNV